MPFSVSIVNSCIHHKGHFHIVLNCSCWFSLHLCFHDHHRSFNNIPLKQRDDYKPNINLSFSWKVFVGTVIWNIPHASFASWFIPYPPPPFGSLQNKMEVVRTLGLTGDVLWFANRERRSWSSWNVIKILHQEGRKPPLEWMWLIPKCSVFPLSALSLPGNKFWFSNEMSPFPIESFWHLFERINDNKIKLYE